MKSDDNLIIERIKFQGKVRFCVRDNPYSGAFFGYYHTLEEAMKVRNEVMENDNLIIVFEERIYGIRPYHRKLDEWLGGI